MATRKNDREAKVLSTDPVRDINKAIDRFLDDPAISGYIGSDTRLATSRALEIVRLFHKRFDRRANAIFRNLKEKKR